MYQDVLIPTDGSEQASEAIDQGLELAALNDASVHAVYVVEPIPLGRFPAGVKAAGSEWGGIVDEQREEGQAAVDDVEERATDRGLEVTSSVRHGRPAEEILEYVDEHDVDAIVMGTHGRSGADRLVIGSVTEKVVRKAPVPVVTVRMGAD